MLLLVALLAVFLVLFVCVACVDVPMAEPRAERVVSVVSHGVSHGVCGGTSVGDTASPTMAMGDGVRTSPEPSTEWDDTGWDEIHSNDTIESDGYDEMAELYFANKYMPSQSGGSVHSTSKNTKFFKDSKEKYGFHGEYKRSWKSYRKAQYRAS